MHQVPGAINIAQQHGWQPATLPAHAIGGGRGGIGILARESFCIQDSCGQVLVCELLGRAIPISDWLDIDDRVATLTLPTRGPARLFAKRFKNIGFLQSIGSAGGGGLGAAGPGMRSGRRPRARSLAGGLRLVTEGYIRSPPLPPTLLLSRAYTSGRPQVESGRQIYMSLIFYLPDSTSMIAHDVENIVFYSVSWPSADMTCA